MTLTAFANKAAIGKAEEMERVAIVSGARTPIGSYGGSLRGFAVSTLGAKVLNAALEKAGLKPDAIDDVIVGQGLPERRMRQRGQGGRAGGGLAGQRAGNVPGPPAAAPAWTRVLIGVMKIQTGNAEVVIAAGMESMSQAEMYLPGSIKWGLGGGKDPKWGFMPRGHGALAMWGVPFFDRIQRARVMSQPIERYGELNSMMTWAETAAKEEGITREAADAWSARSQARAVAAQAAGLFKDEIVPLEIPQKKGDPILFDADETPRPGTGVEKLAKLPTVYPDGVCTAGNSSSENDGAAAVVLMSETKAKELGLTPLAYFVAGANGACDPTPHLSLRWRWPPAAP